MGVEPQARSHGGARGGGSAPLEKFEPPLGCTVPFAVTIGIEVYPPPWNSVSGGGERGEGARLVWLGKGGEGARLVWPGGGERGSGLYGPGGGGGVRLVWSGGGGEGVRLVWPGEGEKGPGLYGPGEGRGGPGVYDPGEKGSGLYGPGGGERGPGVYDPGEKGSGLYGPGGGERGPPDIPTYFRGILTLLSYYNKYILTDLFLEEIRRSPTFVHLVSCALLQLAEKTFLLLSEYLLPVLSN